MDVIKLARELGVALQQDEEYKAFLRAKEANDNDEQLQQLIEQFNLLAATAEYEAHKEDADQAKCDEYNEKLRALYETIMSNEHMVAFEAAKSCVDDKMNTIVAILAAAVNGEDPMTVDPNDHHSCGGDCSHCHGGC